MSSRRGAVLEEKQGQNIVEVELTVIPGDLPTVADIAVIREPTTQLYALLYNSQNSKVHYTLLNIHLACGSHYRGFYQTFHFIGFGLD